ncbi:hypothetical protein ACIPZC_11075 [Pseudomonas sp. NPDC089743]|uniref:hypothetical protein n=1 Tax=Pseudomonas sp. NPDC089743 TaxID=3364471 RepID=UPI00382767D7
MARPTLQQYYNYLKEKPRTYGWGAFLVYDRKKANLLLMQEHIQRADTEDWIEPISGEKEVESGTLYGLSNFRFGAPVLSFENSSIGSSMAALSMPVVSGRLTEWNRAAGSSLPTLVGISHLDPLNAPRVKMNIKLNEGAGGVVDEDGRVYLDLSDSSAYYFEVSQWEELNSKLGELIEAQFKAPGRGEQIWELNALAPVEGELNPTSFKVRTHSLGKAGSPVASTNQADLEEGAVIVGVAFNNARNGGFPSGDEDMPYLLPQRQSGNPYSLNVVLSDEAWVKNVLNSLLDRLSGTRYVPGELTYTRNSSGFFTGAQGGSIRFMEGAFYEIVDTRDFSMRFHVHGDLGQFSFSFAPGKVDCSWSFAGAIEHGAHIRLNVGTGWQELTTLLNLDVRASCSFSTSMEDGVIVLNRGGLTVNGDWGYPGDDYGEEIKQNFAIFKNHLEGYIAGIFNAMAGGVEVVDLLRLNGLLFRNEQRSVADTFANPGDVTMLGELAPALTTFAINPIERTLIAGGTQPLTLTPEPQPGAVEWTVKARPDDPENPVGPEQLGEIVDGVYKAPKADAIAGAFRQVIITATVGQNRSSALFTVVPKAVSVRPVLLNALYSNPGQPQRYVLEGGSIESELVWAKGAGFKGDLRDPTADEYVELKIPMDKQVKVYVAPLSDPDAGPVLGGLMQLDQVQVTGGGRTETIDITVLWKQTAATLKVEAQAGGALKLVLAIQSWGEGEKDLPPEQTKWFVVKGKGTLDEGTGIYSPGSEEGVYVIIAGVEKNGGNWNYAVLPMPYTSEEAQAFHEANQAINGTNASAPYTAEQLEAMDAVKNAFSSLSAART